jgi:hypothetical protein
VAATLCCLCSRKVHALLRQGEGPLPRQGEGQKGRKRLGQQPSHVTSGSARYRYCGVACKKVHDLEEKEEALGRELFEADDRLLEDAYDA